MRENNVKLPETPARHPARAAVGGSRLVQSCGALVFLLPILFAPNPLQGACTGAVPEIIQNPMSLNLPYPSSFAQFNVMAVSSDPLQFQWQLNGANIPGANAPFLQISPVTAADAGIYTVQVINDCGAVTSQGAVLHLGVPTTPPAQDSFESSALLTSPSGILEGNNSAATVQKDEPLHAGQPGGKSVWYRWRNSGMGVVTFDTQGSTFDTLLAVYTGASVDTLTRVTFDDDSGGFFRSKVRFNASPNTVYHIAIDGLGGASGNFLVNWSFEVTNKTIPMIQSHPQSIAVAAGSNVTFKVTGDVPLVGYQWFFNGDRISRATASSYVVVNAGPKDIGFYQVRLDNGPGFETMSFAAALELADPPETVFQNKFSSLVPPAAPGPVLFDGKVDSMVGLPQVQAAAALPRSIGFISITYGDNGFDQGNNSLSDTDAGEPNHCDVPIYHTLWMGLVPNANGVCVLDTAGSDILTHLTLYEWALPITELDDHLIACDVGSAELGLPSTVEFQVDGTKIYVVVIDGHEGATGAFKLNWKFGSAPPILQLPQCLTVDPGESLELSISDNWVPEPAYQWRLNDVDISGANASNLVLEDIQLAQTGAYTVTVSNFLDNVTLKVADVFLTGLFRLEIEFSAPNMLRVHGTAPESFTLEAATSLPGQDWVEVGTFLGNCKPFEFLIPQKLSEPTRFFRGRPSAP